MHRANFAVILAAVFSLLLSTFAAAQCPNSYTINASTLPSCSTSSNGALTLSNTTYYAASTYIWSNGSTARNQSNLSSGHYSVTASDPTGCTYTDATYLTSSPVGLVVTSSFYTCSRQVYASVSWPYSYPVTYNWSDGSTASSITNPAAGVYSVTVTDASGCDGSSTVTVLPYAGAMSASHTAVAASCNASNGSIDLTVTGGVAPYTYTWYNGAQGQIVEDPVNVPVGLSRVYIRDANNCGTWYSVNVPGPQISLNTINMSCGLVNGSATVTTQDMTSPVYTWSNGGNAASITGLNTGIYTVTVTDGSCVITATTSTIYDAGNVTAYIQDSIQGCELNALSVWGSGGAQGPYVAPNFGYTYLWSTGEITRDINMQAGVASYAVTVTDANGCSGSDTVVVSGLIGGLTFSSTVTDATCGNSDGAIDLTVTGGVSSYLWSPTGATTEDISGIAAGFHIVDVTNWNGCVYSDTIPVGEFIEFTATDASCGLTNGAATVYDYGMTSPAFLWSTGATTSALTSLSAGTYYITVTNGLCNIIDTVVIDNAGQTVAGIMASSTCQPDYIAGVPTGGAAPFSFLWNDGSTAGSIATPTPGNSYYVTITDANGCFDSASYIVPNPPLVTATYAVTDAVCSNKNGIIMLTMTGGTLPYNYSWSVGGGNVKNLHNIYPGQYSVDITDNNGCVLEITNIVVGGQMPISVSRVITQVNASNTGGAIDLTVTGVAAPTFLWSNGAITEDLTNLSSGYYTVYVTDPVSGCVFDKTYYLPAPYVSNPNIKIAGYVYDVSATGACQAGLPLQYEMVRLQPLGLVDFTDVYGRYEFNVTTAGNYTVEYINSSPATTTVVCPVGGSYTITGAVQGATYFNNFYLTNPPVQDLWVDLWDWSLASPGFPYYNRIKYCNNGNTVMNGTVEYDYNVLLGFQSITGYGSTLTFHDIPGHKFHWSFANLQPGDCRSLDVRFTVPTSAALGTPLLGTATVFPTFGDATPSDNVDTEYTTIEGSWDPNDKQVEPYHTGDAWAGGTIYETEEELEYTIRFQNTGTAPAHVVVIRDTLDANLLPETIREISTRHDADITIENGNILVFTFDNIYLPDSSTDFEASMGFVKFRINRTSGLPIGTQIENTAHIYFDYNAAVVTNTTVSIIGTITGVVDLDNSVLDVETMPNPFNDQLTLKYTLAETSDVSIKVLNSVGQCVHTHVANQEQDAGVYIEQLRMNNLPSGFYLLSVETEKAILTKKIIKR
jgi:uncharacterized repeat protein (TIGR01451 family)